MRSIRIAFLLAAIAVMAIVVVNTVFAPAPEEDAAKTYHSDPLGDLIEKRLEETEGVTYVSVPKKQQFSDDERLFRKIVFTEPFRLDETTIEFRAFKARVDRFLEFVKLVESDGDRNAWNDTSDAMSYFQFKPDPVVTAVNRLENYMEREGFEVLFPKWATELRRNPQAIFDATELQQKILAFVNILEQPGSDKLLRQLLAGNEEVVKTMYYTHHHTAPDKATRERVRQIFARVFK